MTSTNLSQFIKFALFFVLTMLIIFGFGVLDNYMKDRHQNKFKNIRYDLDENIFRLVLVVILIFAWCFSIFFIKKLNSQNKVISAEILNYKTDEYKISRRQAKSNLSSILEQVDINRGSSSKMKLFDMQWFGQRQRGLYDQILSCDKVNFEDNHFDKRGSASILSTS